MNYKDLKRFLARFKKKIKTPEIKENTFIVWEACKVSHSEVVPGYIKYLSDLGYHVSVLVEPDRIKEGLFCRLNLPNVTINRMTGRESREFFKNGDLSKLKGVIVTTAGKICDCLNYNQCYINFNASIDKKKLFFVEHDLKLAVDNGSWNEKLIMLRKMDYKGAKCIPVNPHYFGDVKITPKNSDIVNFLTVGVLKPRKKNNAEIINAVMELHNKGVHNFKVTVIGKGKMKNIPQEIRKYFDLKGRLNFDRMYEEIEKADFMLTAYDNDNPKHLRYITTGTSGNFQLIYGFLKPCLINRTFAKINELCEKNSIIYDSPKDYTSAMERGITMSQEEYSAMQNNLKITVDKIYEESKKNLKEAIGE